MNITMTGASGFIGNGLANSLTMQGFTVTSIGRKSSNITGLTEITLPAPRELPSSEMPFGDVFIHLAALPETTGKQSRTEVLNTNVQWPLDCLEMAVEKGYKHFIFMSTAKVYCDYSDRPLEHLTELNPNSLYAESKLLAESGLRALKSDIAITVLRPPAVYGLPPKGGFAKLMNTIGQSRPIPRSKGENRRTFVSLNNLVSAIQTSITEVKSGYSQYLIHDHEILSTNSFIEIIAESINKQPKSVYLSPRLMEIGDSCTKILLKREPFAALHRDFYTSCTAFSDRFRWTPAFSTSDGIKELLRIK